MSQLQANLFPPWAKYTPEHYIRSARWKFQSGLTDNVVVLHGSPVVSFTDSWGPVPDLSAAAGGGGETPLPDDDWNEYLPLPLETASDGFFLDYDVKHGNLLTGTFDPSQPNDLRLVYHGRTAPDEPLLTLQSTDPDGPRVKFSNGQITVSKTHDAFTADSDNFGGSTFRHTETDALPATYQLFYDPDAKPHTPPFKLVKVEAPAINTPPSFTQPL
jgi:hypothetical protein